MKKILLLLVISLSSFSSYSEIVNIEFQANMKCIEFIELLQTEGKTKEEISQTSFQMGVIKGYALSSLLEESTETIIEIVQKKCLEHPQDRVLQTLIGYKVDNEYVPTRR